MEAKLAQVRAYHQVSKHRTSGYAPAPGFLDWDSQPQPFRRYEAAPRFELPLANPVEGPAYGDLFEPGAVAAQPVSLAAIGALLELAFGISAWKSLGPERWALRNNPSSGNLHPGEAYLILWKTCAPLAPGLYHYSAYDHSLEQLADFEADESAALNRVFTGSFGALALTSVHWREEWKYGVRALRYCQLDAGHALAAAAVAAATQGWALHMDEQISDDTLSSLLGLDRIEHEPEYPDWLGLLASRDDFELPTQSDGQWRSLIGAVKERHGIASRLSEESIQWPQIRRVLPALEKPVRSGSERRKRTALPPLSIPPIAARDLIRRRRSAQRMNPEFGMDRGDFERCLMRVLPDNALPFAALPYAAAIHLLLFVHGVAGIAPGLYALIRNAASFEHLRRSCGADDLLWQPVTETPLPLYRLKPLTEQRKVAAQLCCYQGIAGKGVFSLGMLADFRELQHEGPWAYRRLFWEAGMIGQMLYLEAELSGLRGTGIGCYFDDDVHALLGLPAEGDWQSLYHFTVGAALEDARLTTEPAYAHLEKRRT